VLATSLKGMIPYFHTYSTVTVAIEKASS